MCHIIYITEKDENMNQLNNINLVPKSNKDGPQWDILFMSVNV